MIRWLWSRMMKWGWDYNRNLREDDVERSISLIDDEHTVDMERAIRFAILPARGGCVFEIRKRDIKTHERETITHVIPEGADVAKEVGNIIAMELLRH